MDRGHWEYIGEFNPEDWFGFVYRIVDTTNNREYIGKKQFFSTTTKPPQKGKTRKRKVVKESNWKTYTSSSTHVNGAIAEKGKDRFVFLIESLHESKSSLHYAEVEAQVFEDVLRAKLSSGERKYYNAMIGNIKFLPKEATSAETIAKIKRKMTVIWMNTDHHYYNRMSPEEKKEWDEKYRIGDNNYKAIMRNSDSDAYEKWLNENSRGTSNPMYGKSGVLSPTYGRQLSEEERKQISNRTKQLFENGVLAKGENHHWSGRNPWAELTEDELASRKEFYTERFSGEKNPMHGRPCTYNMTDEEKERWKENISKATKGKPKSEAFRAKMTGRKVVQKQVTCPHCEKVGAITNMKRYHFDKCKSKDR